MSDGDLNLNKKSSLSRFAPLIVFGLLVAVILIVLVRQNTGDLNIRDVPSPLIGKSVPQFTLPLLDGTGVLTQDTFKGKITLLNVWASWCYACRQEHEAIKWLASKGVRVLGFNYKDEVKDAQAWLQQLGNPYAQVVSDLDGRVGIEWGVYGAPETFVIDSKGIIRDKRIGPVDEAYIEKTLTPLLEKLHAEMEAPTT
jgi:cytochrome c biogenesis protein CcmG/thiol:disulfide interchange protein DsbE